MKKQIILAVILTAFSLQVFPQIKKANKQYDLFRYSKAIPLYKKAAKKKDEGIRKEATARLADCYRLINNVNESRAWYLQATEFKGSAPLNYYYLGQALRSLRQYGEAEKAFRKYSELVPSDKRGSVYADYCIRIGKWKNLPPSAEIRNSGSLNSKFSDFGPSFYKKGITIASDRQLSLMDSHQYSWTSFSYLDLYFSEPKYYMDFFSDMSEPSSLSSKFNQTYHDGPACFVNDSRIFLTRTTLEKVKKGEKNLQTHVLKIYFADLGEGSTTYQEFPFNSDDYSNGHPTMHSDQKTMIFVSDKPGGNGGSDLYKTVMQNGSWSTPENLGDQVNSFGDEVFPTLVNDTLLYFASDGHMGYGGLDLFVSHYVNGKWSAPVNLKAPINSSYDDFAIAVSNDLNSGFLSSDRPGGLGSDDIYAFRNAVDPLKERETDTESDAEQGSLVQNQHISGYVKDKTGKMPLAGAKVFLLNTKSNKVKVLETNAEGYFSSPAERGVLYIAKAVKTDYLTDCLNFRIAPADTVKDQKTPRDLLLDKIEVDKIYLIDNIYYDLDKWYIREDARPALDNLAGILRQYPITIELSSHTDSRASDGYNDELSQKRAEAAVRYIMLQGIDPSRMIAKGYGESKPVNRCKDGVYCTEAEHQANRRTEFRILSIEKPEVDKGFDPSVFTTGEEVDVYLFDPAFFDRCFGSDEETPAIRGLLNNPVTTPGRPVENTGEKTTAGAASCFSVQILASVTEIALDDAELKGVDGVKSYFSGKWYRYVVGCVNTYEEAATLKNELIAKGITNAFVVKIENGNVVSAH